MSEISKMCFWALGAFLLKWQAKATELSCLVGYIWGVYLRNLYIHCDSYYECQHLGFWFLWVKQEDALLNKMSFSSPYAYRMSAGKCHNQLQTIENQLQKCSVACILVAARVVQAQALLADSRHVVAGCEMGNAMWYICGMLFSRQCVLLLYSYLQLLL